ncbi:MAG: nicotinate phosphoribosyltransferase, partial [Zetaproteobacteria bacterium]
MHLSQIRELPSMLDLATRAHNHSYRIDPVLRSLLDTDFYKFLMLQFIWLHYRSVPVTFSLINRTTTIRLADAIPEADLRAQLDHARTLRFTKSELIWLAGNTFYGQVGMFRPDFLAWLASYQLPPYHLAEKDGQYELTFSGPWAEVTLWEIPAVAIVNTLRNRQGLQRLSRFELDVLYAQAKTNLWRNLLQVRDEGIAGLADFGTRRRHDYLYHEWAVLAARDVLGPSFSGTSNVLLAMRHDIEAIGTNGHELPMVIAALAQAPDDLRASQFEVLARWQETYGGRLLVFLPDTYGTTQFLANAPAWVDHWTGFRIDSKEPFEGGEEAI